jgi:hypothetical protein
MARGDLESNLKIKGGIIMDAVIGRAFGKEIADILKIPNAFDMIIHIPIDGIVTIEVKFYPNTQQIKDILGVTEKYQLSIERKE